MPVPRPLPARAEDQARARFPPLPCSLPNKMISGFGSSFVQLVIALRWITPMCPWNGFATAQTVIRGEARESGGLRVLRLTRRVTP